ncbi:hypothetical protein HMPREF0072_1267 [Anaerococcus lactolyticus ATCC 51172]|uniref:Lipoprotein n=1 Tax=Anaerococcus lactolyticus ATCC 51172 TaxID=525254 RepID=C2BFZ7_9FIRM|nr:hypothetical protein [Anaerococcus lactolyticus]EEI86112.1 hypothetical protein HMPREF0072_1267 [Anaerococcus lactolyticus ATCC 51172]
MKKKILVILALCLVFTACKADKDQNKETENKPVQEVQSQEKEEGKDKKEDKDKKEGKDKKEAEIDKEKEKTDEEKLSKDEKNSDSKIFSMLEDKEFVAYITDRSDFIYFYKDGTFDGCTYSGGPEKVACLYTGRFGKPRKLDDKSYSLTLEEIKYQTPTKGNIEGSKTNDVYYPSIYFDESMKGQEYIVYLPGTNLHDLEQVGVSHELGYDENVKNGVINMYTIAKNPVKSLDYPGEVIFMEEETNRKYWCAKPELKKEDPENNCFQKLLFGDKPNPYKGKL